MNTILDNDALCMYCHNHVATVLASSDGSDDVIVDCADCDMYVVPDVAPFYN